MAKIVRLLLPFFHNCFLEAGVDEAGRGCFAGPVFAAAVVLPADFYHPELNDSKQIACEKREELRHIIEEKSIAWAVASVCNQEIDRINILQASYKAMHLAIRRLSKQPDLLLVDGNRFKPFKHIPHHCVVKGDGTYAAIAAASILAKTHRDAFMEKLHRKHTVYGWKTNKGYGTAEHRAAIRTYGISKYHRQSFRMTGPDADMLPKLAVCDAVMTAEEVPAPGIELLV